MDVKFQSPSGGDENGGVIVCLLQEFECVLALWGPLIEDVGLRQAGV